MAKSECAEQLKVETALQYVNVLFCVINVSGSDWERRAVAMALVRLSADACHSLPQRVVGSGPPARLG